MADTETWGNIKASLWDARQGMEWCADMELLIADLVKEEREACAKLAESMLVKSHGQDYDGEEIAAAIRARGEK